MYGCIHVRDEEAFEQIGGIAAQFSPLVEARPPRAVIASLKGLERLMGNGECIAQQMLLLLAEKEIVADIAIAATANAAYLAAMYFRGVTVLRPGEEAARLGGLPIAKLAMPEEMLGTLRSWGIRNFAGFTALPPLGILERFGQEGLRWQGLACGQGERPLLLEREAHVYREETRLDHALDNLEPLLFLLNAALVKLCERLLHNGVAAGEMRLDLGSTERTVALPYPLREAKTMLKIWQLHLEADSPGKAVTKVDLTLVPVALRVAQGGLYQPSTPEPARLQVTVARIAALVGRENIGSPRLLNTHRPDAFVMEPIEVGGAVSQDRRDVGETPLSLRLFRPPLYAEVRLDGGEPGRVTAACIAGAVVSCAGPWRASGDWWNALVWARDEWDVAIEDCGVYRIYQQPDTRWFVDGVYD